MNKVIPISTNQPLSDEALLNGVKNFDEDCNTRLYKKHRDYCMNFMRRMYQDEEEIKDIYQDSVVLLIEKVRANKFELTNNAGIQTYLNSVCRNQVLIRLKNRGRMVLVDPVDESNIDLKIKDWYEEETTVKNERLAAIEVELINMKTSNPKCYELLYNFYYRKMSMADSGAAKGSSSDTIKNQSSRCRGYLKEAVFTNLRLQ